ncbi:hypothetical protein IC614_02530 [Allosphingosinicella flava]|uniref:Uncharacterized protein n=1 Tax=Allosphingosinicella flava TaxID=2771430 RepID=A0A7T2GKF0_9SPHN|nr:hypothetical protein [Sphingosinicella flava]QPQ55498.1 hypothetical protein IC614_02530 [Sphingosinicella flava]
MGSNSRVSQILLAIAASIVGLVAILHGSALGTIRDGLTNVQPEILANVNVVWLAVTGDLLLVALLWFVCLFARVPAWPTVFITALIPLSQAVNLALNIAPAFPPALLLGLASALAITAALRMRTGVRH